MTATNVADRLWEDLKIRIDRRKLAVGTIKRIGRYTVPVEVFGDVTAELRLLIVPEGGELPPEEALEAAAAAEAEEAEAANARPEAEALVEEEPVTAEPAGEEDRGRRGGGRASRPTRPKRPSSRPGAVFAHSPIPARVAQGCGSARPYPHRCGQRSAAVLHTSSTGCGLRRELLAQSEVFLGDRPPCRPLDMRTYVLSCLHITAVPPTSHTGFHSVADTPVDRLTCP